MEIFTFQTEDELLGIDARYVYCVIDGAKAMPVPLAPACFLGLLYYRGELFNVIDIAGLLGSAAVDQNENHRIILVKWSDKKLGLLSNKVMGLEWNNNEDGNGPPASDKRSPARLIAIERIWDALLKLPYGLRQISKDFHPGVGEISRGTGQALD